jgi:hypothetical protein
MPDRIQVMVLAHVVKIAIAQFDGFAQGLDGAIGAFEESVTAGEIVVSECVVWAELDEAFVDLEALGIAALEGKIVALNAKDIDIVGVLLQDTAEEFNLEIQLILIVGSDERLACGRGF